MVVLAASICTKAGKPVISRQFRDMTRARIESLLASFPKLIPANTQHTTVETADVRYVYQPLEDLYVLLITNRASNILQDIDTLHLISRVVSDLCRSADERDILKSAFELLGAFDEIVSLGYREQVNLTQVRSVLEMESHEEKIQEIIARNKEAEAKEELKRRAKQLEMQRREQQRRAASGMGGSGLGGSSYLGGGVTGYSPVPRYDTADVPSSRPTSASPAPSSLRAPAFQKSGMKLGSKKTKQAELLDALGADGLAAAAEDVSAPATPQVAQGRSVSTTGLKSNRGSVPEVAPESIHIATRESLSIALAREGGVESFELKGDMNLTISDPSLSYIKLVLAPPTTDWGNDLQIKQHPHIAKFASGSKARVVALKDASKSFPVGQSLAVLRWRYAGKDESYVPLSINCWPTPSKQGTLDVNIEYELENEHITLYDVVVSIPLPTGSYPTVSAHSGSWSLNPSSHSLDWSIPIVSASDEATRSGSMEYSIGGEDPGSVFPLRVNFIAQGSLSSVKVDTIEKLGEGGGQVPAGEGGWSQDAIVSVDEYLVV